MAKTIKVTIEFEDKIITVEGKEAEKWSRHVGEVGTMAAIHGCNPFENNPIK